MPSLKSIVMNFDSHIQKIIYQGDTHIVWTASGQSQSGTFVASPGTYLGFEVTLEDGYIIDSVTADRVKINSITDTEFNTTDNFTTTATITITSKLAGGEGDKMTYDLSTSTKWSTLSDGDHIVTIVAKADGYRASEPSAGVTVSKGGE